MLAATLPDPRPKIAAAALFDVCHVGVVLRVLLAAYVLLAVAVLFAAHDLASWFGALLAGSAMVLPATLLWLLASCALKRPLARWPRRAQAVAAATLGACGGAAGWGFGFLGAGDTVAVGPWPVAASAALAGFAMFHWLALRAQAQLPADTTARLAELQSRIRPHFLFNTLNTALSLVRLDPARAEGVLEDLAELFRAALRDDTGADADGGTQADGSVTLADEVELAKRYLAIEQIRFGARLQVAWELDPAAAGARVPPLLLQPLVENAVRHGVEPADAGGLIRVHSRVKLGRVFLTISNSVPEAASTPGHGIALRNVRERLRLMHDVAAQLDVQRTPGEFSVQVVLPL